MKLSDETVPGGGAGLGVAGQVEMTQCCQQRITIRWIAIPWVGDSMREAQSDDD